MDISVESVLWFFIIIKLIEKKERIFWGLCGLDLLIEGKVNN